MLHLTTALLAFAPTALRPGMRPAVRSASVPTMGLMDAVDALKGATLPKNSDATLRNVFGYQALAWGVGGLVAPGLVTSKCLGAASTAASTTLTRGLGVINLALAGRFFAGSDADAASTGFLWFALWYKTLSEAATAGTIAGPYVGAIVLANAAQAVVCARRQGGLFDVVTKADTSILSSVLPSDYELTTRNFVGMQISAWGAMGMFFTGFLTNLIGFTAGGTTSLALAGVALSNLILGGKVMAGTDDDAAVNGLTFFGAWAILGWLAKGAGVFTGQYMNLITLWNAAAAVFCASKLI